MARVHSSTFVARQGATLTCQTSQGPHPIEKGERYYWVKPRSAYRKMVRCAKHPFRQSETDMSKMSAVWAAVEAAEDALDALAAGDPEDGDADWSAY